jgi:hypothetical protein
MTLRSRHAAADPAGPVIFDKANLCNYLPLIHDARPGRALA